MIPSQLAQLAREGAFEREASFRLRVRFGIACIERVEHLLTSSAVVACLAIGKQYLEGNATDVQLSRSATEAAQLATSHAGAASLDGSGSAAVSVSRGAAAALAGRALEAAEYAAYASVYSYASYAATDLANYAEEHAWQIATLRHLIDEHTESTQR
jgi:hypothetical protein